MPRLYRNSIVITKNKHTILDLFQCVFLDDKYSIYFDKNIPILKTESLLLLGWAWDCEFGTPISEERLFNINPDNILEDTLHFSGRYLLIARKRYLYTDAVSSFPIYYSMEYIGNNLSLMCSLTNQNPNFEKMKNEILFIPPGSGVEGIRRLMPGQYFDLSNYKVHSLKGYLSNKIRMDMETIKNSVIDELTNSGDGILKLSEGDYRLMLTGGKDSRLSLLSLNKTSQKPIKAFTHKKPLFFNDPNDIKTPKKLSRKFRIDHFFTKTTNENFYCLDDIQKHSPLLAGTIVPGSTYYYYLKSNWNQVAEKFLIDNYYEIGRMHLHNKGFMPSKEYITVENIKKYGYKIDEKLFPELILHLTAINGSNDLLDTYYFVKNYINVANQFEMIDYSHNPLIYCNSLFMFRLLLNVPNEHRMNGIFHLELIKEMTPQGLKLPECNKNSSKLTFKILRRALNKLGEILHK